MIRRPQFFFVLPVVAAVTVACGSDPVQPLTDEVEVDTLVTDLHHPSDLAVGDGVVYVIETKGGQTSFGGRRRLSSYSLPSGTLTPLLEDPVNHYAITVGPTGSIFLGGTSTSIPGNVGHVSQVDPDTGVESHMLDVPAAVSGLTVNAGGDLIVLGSSLTATAPGLMSVPLPGFATVDTLVQGLGRTRAPVEAEGGLYFGSGREVHRFDGGVRLVLVRASLVVSMAANDSYIYVADLAGRIARMDLASGDVLTIVEGLEGLLGIAYDPDGEQLFFVQGGDSSTEYTNGVFGVIRNLPE